MTFKSSLALAFFGSAMAISAATITWSTTGATVSWNTVDENWTGEATVFSTGDATIFDDPLGEPITVDEIGVTPASTGISNNGNWTFSGGSILGGSLSKSGTGSLTLNAANSFNSILISGGPNAANNAAINLGNANALGTGDIALGNTGTMTALFFQSGFGSNTLANNITFASGAVQTNLLATAGISQVVTLDGLLSGGNSGATIFLNNNVGGGVAKFRVTNSSNSVLGTWKLNRGALEFTNDAALGNSANDITLDVTGTNAGTGLTFGANNIVLNSGRSLTVQSQTIIDTAAFTASQINGAVSFNAQMVKRGSTILTLNAAGSGAGGTRIDAGSISIGNSAALGTGAITFNTTGNAMLQTTALSGAVTLANNIVLNNPGAAGNLGILAKGGSGNSLQINGVISGGGANTTLFLNTDVVSDVTGKFILNNASTYTGNTYINRGSVQLNNAAGFGTSAVRFDSNLNAVLSFNGPMTVANNISYTFAAKRIDTGSNDVTLSGVQNLVVPVTKQGTGKLTLTNINTGNSSLIVSAGTLELADNAQLRFVLGATSGTNNQLSGAGSVILNGDFNIVTTAADSLSSGTWLLENVPTLTDPYGETFSVVGFTDAGDNKWTKSIGGGKTYTFDEATGTLTLATAGFDSWIADKGLTGPDAEFDADPDNDGVANGLEFVLGGEPNPATEGSNSLALLPQVSETGGDLIFSFNRKDLSENATSLVFQWSADLSFPSPASDVPVGATSSSVDGISVAITEDVPDAETDTIVITVPAAKVVTGRIFGRLRAVSNP